MNDTMISHPAPRAAHAIRNAIQVARALAVTEHGLPPNTAQANEIASRIEELLGPALEDVAAVHQDNEAKAEEIAALNDDLRAFSQSVARDLAYIERLEQSNSGLATELLRFRDTLDQIIGQIAQLAGTTSVLFSEARALKREADSASPVSAARPTVTTSAPQLAAVGA